MKAIRKKLTTRKLSQLRFVQVILSHSFGGLSASRMSMEKVGSLKDPTWLSYVCYIIITIAGKCSQRSLRCIWLLRLLTTCIVQDSSDKYARGRSFSDLVNWFQTSVSPRNPTIEILATCALQLPSPPGIRRTVHQQTKKQRKRKFWVRKMYRPYTVHVFFNLFSASSGLILNFKSSICLSCDCCSRNCCNDLWVLPVATIAEANFHMVVLIAVIVQTASLRSPG